MLHDIPEKLGLPKSNIVKCCKGQRNKVGGFIWKYKYIEDGKEKEIWQHTANCHKFY